MNDRVRHVLGLSGGKDSAALAIYMRDRVPEMEYYFCDTGKELPETYEYLGRLEAALGRPIIRLNADRDFDHWMFVYGGTLPSPQMRWCTKNLKIRPFEEWVGDDTAYSYIAIRADENRTGYISTRPNILPVYPFKEDGIDADGVTRILEDAGVGLPAYYEWRSRSGCYFCFFQRKIEWVRLSERHPDLFAKAIEYEDKISFEDKAMRGRQYTWSQGESLRELIARKDEIVAKHEAQAARVHATGRSLLDVLGSDPDDTCLVCHL